MGDYCRDSSDKRYEYSRKEQLEIELIQVMADKLIDDDLDFNPHDVLSLVQVQISALNREYAYFAHFDGAVMQISGKEFRQVFYSVLKRLPHPTFTGLDCDGYVASLFILDAGLAGQFKRFRDETPVSKVWHRIEEKVLVQI